MTNNLKEIYTKATIAYGKKHYLEKYRYSLDHVDKILGCWITNHRYSALLDQGQPVIVGSFEAHVWYQVGNDSQLFKQANSYSLNITFKNDTTYHQDDLLICDCLHDLKCTQALLQGESVVIQVETDYSLKVIGDTTILVESKEKKNENDVQNMMINDKFIT